MKILSNKEYMAMRETVKNQLEKLIYLGEQRKKDLAFYGNLLDDLYNDLVELNKCLKLKISREKIQIRIQNMIIKIGGR